MNSLKKILKFKRELKDDLISLYYAALNVLGQRYLFLISLAFSPDGDGINDFFNVVGQGLTNYTIEIYNRWGQMVFKSYDMNVKWDGNFRNKKAPAGTYVYKVNSVDFGSEIKLIKSGSVSLVR